MKTCLVNEIVGFHLTLKIKLSQWIFDTMHFFFVKGGGAGRKEVRAPFCCCLEQHCQMHRGSFSCVLCTWVRGGSRTFFRRGCTRLLLHFNTNKPHSFFFLGRIPVVLENRRSSQGGCSPPAPSP